MGIFRWDKEQDDDASPAGNPTGQQAHVHDANCWAATLTCTKDHKHGAECFGQELKPH